MRIYAAQGALVAILRLLTWILSGMCGILTGFFFGLWCLHLPIAFLVFVCVLDYSVDRENLVKLFAEMLSAIIFTGVLFTTSRRRDPMYAVVFNVGLFSGSVVLFVLSFYVWVCQNL